ncbi:HAD-IA family hydrolase [Brachyspira hampsonii]|uniref:Phosphatase, HAD family protein n=1 Tax=Brachyspira hampsonii 30446 TaxID=1289135 RepID=A0A2U4EUZ9_9SPIR|nr:HAD-IA family hydrolase [Brachyspira hampsonii]EKV56485.1 phosphatase, HAD family protein [Brachyspira hampsonii 30446]MBW5388599.1 HAD family hydrolase [Brachyspira hampsonii]MBW5394132.1 HAD family hydrolase [Brachyspira hampsonii]OEJ20337.1 phosphatase [Brachyspira hampsonii]
MPKYVNILFDLDGTITDSAPGIMNGILYGIKKINELYNLNINIPDNDTLRKFIGPPLDASFKKYCLDDEKLSLDFIKFYREDYNGNDGLFNCTLYDGIYDLIKTLYENNYRVFLATAKPKESALRIIEHFSMTIFFTNFYAPILGGKIKSKLDVLKEALEKENFEKDKTIMIGDRIDDIDAAKNVGIDSIAVKYGFGNDEEFKNASYIVNNTKEIFDILSK